MASEGWIKLHRCLFKKAIWLQSTPEQKVVLITLLGMANHCGKEWEWQGKQFKAEPGQFVTSLESITKKCGKGISMQNVRSSLKKFEKYEFLTQEVTKTGRLINIVNWELYQGLQEETNKEVTKDLTKNQQTGNKELTTNKNDKNNKNDKEVYIDLKFVDEVIEKVKLTQEQYSKLINKYDKEYVHKEILGLDNYIVNGKGAKYKDHYRTLNTWLRTRKAPAPKEDRHYGFDS